MNVFKFIIMIALLPLFFYFLRKLLKLIKQKNNNLK